MATKTKDDIHGEEQSTPRFGDYKPDSSGNQAGNVYDDQKTALGDASDPRGGNQASGDSSDPRASGGSSSSSRGGVGSNLAEQEGAATGTTAGLAEDRENALLNNRGGLFKKESEASGKSSLVARFKAKQKRSIVTLAAAGIIGGGGVFGFSILQGPFQLVHLAQQLQRFHLSSNDDFSSRRLSKVYYYASGDGQRSRLGYTANKAADAWEKKLLKESGMRPIYQDGTKRFIGFEIVDDAKAERYLGQISEVDSRSGSRIEASMGRGAAITSASEIDGGASANGKDRLDGKTRILNLSQVSFADRKAWIKTIGQATNTNKLVSSMSSRLLIKRAGVNFHPMNKLKGKMDAAAAKKIKEKREKSLASGTEAGTGQVGTDLTEDVDNNGTNDSASSVDTQGSEEANKLISDFKSQGGNLLSKAAGPAAVVGVLCAAKDFGKNVEDYKFANNILPMMRMGFEGISAGNQVMSGDDIDIATIGEQTQYLYDKDKKTSWSQAESIRAEQGKSGGTAMPAAADLGKAGKKPALFLAIDEIPLLGKFCSVGNFVGNLPVIKDVSGLISGAAASGINGALGLAGSDKSVEDLMTDALSAVAGKSINADSKGADYGNLANTGAFLAGNDQAIAMGGKDLTDGERVNVAMLQKSYDKMDNSNKSLMARYFNPYDSESAISAVIDTAPSNPTQTATMLTNPFRSFASSFSGLLSLASPKASAAANIYDYGMPKVGFSVSEQASDIYENPYENATRTDNSGKTLEDDLPRLNEKYGQKCFGMSVTADDTGVHIQTKDKSEMKDVYKNRAKESDCKDTDDRLNQYRMYIADAVAAVTASCNEGDDDACAELGFGKGAQAEDSTENLSTDGNLDDNKDKFTEILKLPSGTKGPSQLGYYNQSTDSRWAQKPYPYAAGGSNTISASGCGPSSLAMVISTLGNKVINPYEMSQLAKAYHVSGGTDMNGAIGLVEKYGLKQKKIGSNIPGEVKKTLEAGGLVVMSANASSPFTQAGHFVVIRAISNDGSKFYVGDPADDNSNGLNRNSKEWPVSSISGWTSTGLWSVEKK